MLKFGNDINFLFEIGNMRKIARTRNEFFGKDVANIAEHTLRVSWIALTIAKYEKNINIGHILKLAIVHDISEIRSVDTHYISRQYTMRDEIKAVKDTLSKSIIGQEFIELRKEIEEKKTIEAQIVKDADNIDVDLEIIEKIYEGYKVGEMRKKDRLNIVNKKLFTKTAKKIQKEIYKSNPHDRHLLSDNNRFKKDWK